MKMHSFFKTNLMNRLNHSENDLNEYPNNLTFNNYFHYLAYPTFVYEYSYPLSESKGNCKLLLKRLSLIITTLASLYIIFVDHMYPNLEIIGEVSAVLFIPYWYPLIMMITLVVFLNMQDFFPNFYAELFGYADR